MHSPFPGMDPYLENPDHWPDVHTRWIAELGNVLSERLRPRYVVAVEERTYLQQAVELVLIGAPDVAVAPQASAPGGSPRAVANAPMPQTVTVPLPDEITERCLEVRDVGTGEVVTVIELLSPANKRPGKGRRLYLRKRLAVLGTATHLVEIDLLRAGRRPPTGPEAPPGGYAILVSRSPRRPKADLYPFGVRETIPAFPLPLRTGEEEPTVELKSILDTVYARAGYDLRVDYGRGPIPPLGSEDAGWASALLASRR